MTPRTFIVTLPRSKQQQTVTAYTCGELGDILNIHWGGQGIGIAVLAWWPEDSMRPPAEVVREVKA